MKSLTQFIKESVDTDWIDEVLKLSPTRLVDVKRYFEMMYQNGFDMHPDDSWSTCTYSIDKNKAYELDEWVNRAYEEFGDKLYDLGTEIKNKYMKIY